MKTHSLALRNSKGFTFIEVLVVILILGILTAVIYPKLSGRETAAKIQTIESDMLRIGEACQAHRAGNGKPDYITSLILANLSISIPSDYPCLTANQPANLASVYLWQSTISPGNSMQTFCLTKPKTVRPIFWPT